MALWIFSSAPVELVAVGAAALLVAVGALTAEEAFRGFSDSAVVTVGAMFVLAAGLSRTGALSQVSAWISAGFRRGCQVGIFTLTTVVGVLSAFVNNTACTALFVPITRKMSEEHGLSLSRLLLPVSYASILGGTCTLVGTSTNLVVQSVLTDHGLPPFGMFEFSAMGMITLVVGVLYLSLVGYRWLPDRAPFESTLEGVLPSDRAPGIDLHEQRPDRVLIALSVFATVMVVGTLGWIPLPAIAVLGCLTMLVTGCLTVAEAYRALDLRVLLLIGGALSLGAAMEETGVLPTLASSATASLAPFGPVALIGGVYLLTMIMTEMISNTATAALVAPLAIAAAHSQNMDPRPFLIAVTFAASASFMTPVGYQTNTMIYRLGQYRFSDFIRVGLPLNLLLWVLASVFIPWLWPP